MATKKNAETAGGEQERQERQGQQGQRGVADAAASGAGASRPDLERPRQVSREGTPEGVQPGESVGAQAGMQRNARQGVQRGGALAGRQGPSVLPAFMAHPGLMASAFMTNPFEFAQLMANEMDRIFDTFGPTGGAGLLLPAAGARQLGGQRGGAQQGSSLAAGQPRRGAGGVTGYTPQIEVRQRGNEIVVRADLPGVSPDDVTVEIEDGVLAISGERREEAEEQREGFYHTERRYGSFYRAIPLPEGVSEEQINASFRDGVLEVTVPLPPAQEPQRARRIPIQGAGGTSAREVRGASAGGAGGSSPTGGETSTSAG